VKITDYNYIGSAIGNAYFSGVSFNELWNCIVMCDAPDELDAAISATIRLKELSTKNEN
jgi:hypothetical protein